MARQQVTQKKAADNKDVKENTYTAALSYVWILCLVPLFGKRDSKFTQFHAKQGLILFAIEIVGGLFFWVPILGPLLFLTLMVISLIGVLKALNGKWWKIPYIYKWSQKIKL